MLLSLHIENIAVIESLDVTFDNGLNVLSGETGAGKSIIIDSINMVLGGRTSRDLLRNGTDRARVQALFAVACEEELESLGIQTDGPELLLSRDLFADGRSVCRVNGALVTAGILREAAPFLINIHGQHDNQALLQAVNHLAILDSYADNTMVRMSYTQAYQQLREVERRLNDTVLAEQEKQEKQELYAKQLQEIESAGLHSGEEEELQAQCARLSHAETIAGGVNDAYDRLYGNVHDSLAEAVRALDEAAEYDEDLALLAERIGAAGVELDEAAHELRAYGDALEHDPQALDEAESRLDTIRLLERSYGATIDAVLSYRDEIRAELERFESSDALREQLEGERNSCIAELRLCAAELTGTRREAADRLCAKITEQLQSLDMKQVRFAVEIKEIEPGGSGADRVEFLLSTNPGEAPKPMTKIASGGELSRIMLAIKTVLADVDDVDTLIFDEIDTGVSGRAAQRIAAKLFAVSGKKQVLCITHLSQIAAMADHHYLIEKNTEDGRAKTAVIPLSHEERLKELSRMIGGVEITELTLQNAAQMLQMAEEEKRGLAAAEGASWNK